MSADPPVLASDLLALVVPSRHRDGITGDLLEEYREVRLPEGDEGAAWKTVLVDGRTGEPVVPNGSLGFRYTGSGTGRWNLNLGDVAPQLTLFDREHVEVLLPRFDALDGSGGCCAAGCQCAGWAGGWSPLCST